MMTMNPKTKLKIQATSLLSSLKRAKKERQEMKKMMSSYGFPLDAEERLERKKEIHAQSMKIIDLEDQLRAIELQLKTLK